MDHKRMTQGYPASPRSNSPITGSFNAATRSGLEACSVGASPQRIAVTSVKPMVKAKTIGSGLGSALRA